jgi:ethylmalonyl-CoA/methylmalonyl-CoA decarboxylase
MVDLSEVVSRLETWKTGKGVIVYGKGDAFCSGGYLKTVREIANSRDGLKMAKLMHDSLVRLRSLPLVSVSLIHGKVSNTLQLKLLCIRRNEFLL